jgi:hypothetical protein
LLREARWAAVENRHAGAVRPLGEFKPITIEHKSIACEADIAGEDSDLSLVIMLELVGLDAGCR